MTTCSSCNNPVSTRATLCPFCGGDLYAINLWGPAGWIIVGVLFILVLIVHASKK